MSDKLIQIVDEHDQPTGAATMDEAQFKGLWHRISRVMVEDGHGNILLQKRGPNMATSPNIWDHSAAGHVDEGESYEAAATRELAEETGIKNVRVQELGGFKSQKTKGGRIFNRFNKVYRAVVEPGTKLNPDAGEVAELRWFTIPEAKKLMTGHPEDTTDGLRYAMAKFY